MPRRCQPSKSNQARSAESTSSHSGNGGWLGSGLGCLFEQLPLLALDGLAGDIDRRDESHCCTG